MHITSARPPGAFPRDALAAPTPGPAAPAPAPRADVVEARLLLIVKRRVESFERGPHVLIACSIASTRFSIAASRSVDLARRRRSRGSAV